MSDEVMVVGRLDRHGCDAGRGDLGASAFRLGPGLR